MVVKRLTIFWILTLYSISVQHCSSQIATLTPENAEVVEGQDIMLTCSVFMEVDFVAWSPSSRPIINMGVQNSQCTTFESRLSNKYSYNCNKTTYHLTIHHVDNIEHGDIWTCVPQGRSIGPESTITVIVPIKSVTLTPATYQVDIMENTQQHFTCTTSEARPPGTIFWYKLRSGTRTLISRNITFNERRKNDTGLIASVSRLQYVPTRDDGGTKIYCEAKNKVNGNNSVESTQKTLNVLYPPTVLPLSNVTVVEGNSVDPPVVCKATPGNPPNTYMTWWKGNVELVARRQVTELQLPLNNVKRNEAGIYVCVADNTMVPTVGDRQTGYDMKQFSLIVFYAANIARFEEINQPGVSSEVTVNENDETILTCVTDSKPGSVISILKENVVKTDGTLINKLLYTIRKTTCLDAGTYTCIGYNDIIGQVSRPQQSLQLHVRCSPRLSPINETLLNQTGTVNTTAALQVYIMAYPTLRDTQLTWKKRSGSEYVTVSADRINSVVSTTGLVTKAYLVIFDVQRADFGEYLLHIDHEIQDANVTIFFYSKDEMKPTERRVCVSAEQSKSVPVVVVIGSNIGTALFTILAVILLQRIWRGMWKKDSAVGPKYVKSPGQARLNQISSGNIGMELTQGTTMNERESTQYEQLQNNSGDTSHYSTICHEPPQYQEDKNKTFYINTSFVN